MNIISNAVVKINSFINNSTDIPKEILNELYEIIDHLKTIKGENDFDKLKEIVGDINFFHIQLDDNQFKNLESLMIGIEAELKSLMPTKPNAKPQTDDINSVYMSRFNSYRLTAFNQKNFSVKGEEFKGLCYGYVMAYALHRNQQKGRIALPDNFGPSDEVKYAQKNQQHEKEDQKHFVSKRIDRQRLEINMDKRADMLMRLINDNQDKDLRLTLMGIDGGHALFIRKDNDGHIHFFDPNHGLYEFKNDSEFKEFYTSLHIDYTVKSRDYPIYELTELVPKKNLEQVDTLHSMLGKFRTMLTGSKYYFNNAGSLKVTHTQGLLTKPFHKRAQESKDKNIEQALAKFGQFLEQKFSQPQSDIESKALSSNTLPSDTAKLIEQQKQMKAELKMGREDSSQKDHGQAEKISKKLSI